VDVPEQPDHGAAKIGIRRTGNYSKIGCVVLKSSGHQHVGPTTTFHLLQTALGSKRSGELWDIEM